MSDPAPRKRCFVVGPIGSDDSEDRIHADWLLEMIVVPVFAEYFPNFDVIRADRITNPGRIDDQMISQLLTADLVIADLTTLNPNAFYEIGIRHAIQKPIIHMHLDGQSIPFDIASFRSIKFSRKWPRDLVAAKDALRNFAQEATSPDHVIDNPVTYSRGRIEFRENATPSDKLLQDQISSLSRRLSFFENNYNAPHRSSQDPDDRPHVSMKVRWKEPTDHQDATLIINSILGRTDTQNWTMHQSGNEELMVTFERETMSDEQVDGIISRIARNPRCEKIAVVHRD